jgi:hypothetical protein
MIINRFSHFVIIFFITVFIIGYLGSTSSLKAQKEEVPVSEEYEEEVSELTEKFLNQKISPKNLFDKKKWGKSSEGFDYRDTITKEKEKKVTDKKKEKKQDSDLSPLVKEIIKYSLFLVVIVVLVLLLFKLITGNSIFVNKKIVKQISFSIEEIEENLFEADIDKFILQTVSNKEYKMAIRLYYLNVLKILAEKNIILYKKDKTNGNYIVEIMDNSLQNEFKECTDIYEYVWFKEDVKFEKDDFEKAVPVFNDIILKASSTNS